MRGGRAGQRGATVSEEGNAGGDEPRLAALKETLRLYAERSRDAERSGTTEDKEAAERESAALREAARAVVPTE